jgi:hypothetical protein
MLSEAKTLALCSINYGRHPHPLRRANGDTWMEARKAVVERDVAAKKLDDVVFTNVHPPPMATQPHNLGRVSAIAVGASTTTSRSNDVSPVHKRIEPKAETETALDNKSAVTFEKHCIRLRMAAGWGMARLPRIYSRAPALRPLLHRRRSCPRGPAARRRAPRARGAQPRPVPHLPRCARGQACQGPGAGGGHRHARGWQRSSRGAPASQDPLGLGRGAQPDTKPRRSSQVPC